MYFALMVMLLGCEPEKNCDDDIHVTCDGCDCDETTDDDTGAGESSLSDCGQQVIDEGYPNAFTECFAGDDDWGACETCGYYMDVSMSQGAYDCITCPEGYEIDVHFGDCTGYCVPEGNAVVPISASDCEPVSDCVLE